MRVERRGKKRGEKGEGRELNEDMRETKEERKEEKYKEWYGLVPAAAAAAACAVLVCPPDCNCIITPFPNISTNNFAVEFSAGAPGVSFSPFLSLSEVLSDIVSKPTGCKLNLPAAPIAFGSLGLRTS